MFKFFVVILVATTVSQCAAKCFNNEIGMTCSSFEDFYNPILRGNTWEYVEIEAKEKRKINATILTSVPNIRAIYFKGSVNNIADSTFAAPSNLEYIKFENCELPIVRETSFVFNSNYNVTLSIEDSKVNYLLPNCFAKSINLYDLKLKGNNITKININVFNGTLIARLNLRHNKIKYIEDNALSNMPRLHRLELRENFLRSFDAKLYLNNIPNLVYLSLSRNKIEFLNKNNFILFPELRVLLLDSNEIHRIEDDAFNGLSKLNILKIANNSLYSLPNRSFPSNGLPSLKLLDITNNRLNYLPKHFLLWFPKLTHIHKYGNPWQCACYKDIMKALSYTNVTIRCADEFLDGQRPVCVVPQTGDGKCDVNIADPNELYKTFMDGLKEYNTLTYYISAI